MTSVCSSESEMKALGFVLQGDGTWKKQTPVVHNTYPQARQRNVVDNSAPMGAVAHSQIPKFSNSQIVFPISPCPAPRMTKRDQWRTPDHPDPDKRQRKCVTKYFAFKNDVKIYSAQFNYTLSPELTITFTMPMPVSWSIKKRSKFVQKPHQVRPDVDNMTKAWMDSFGVDDGYVWHIDAKKVWGESGSITILRQPS